MTTENVPYNDEVYIVKHIVNKSNSFSSTVDNNEKPSALPLLMMTHFRFSIPYQIKVMLILNTEKRIITFLFTPFALFFHVLIIIIIYLTGFHLIALF